MTARVDGIKELQMTINVDRNVVVCQAAKSRNGKTSIILVTPKDAWTKEFVITSDSVFGYHLKCGDRYGTLMQGLNGNNKYNKVELPVVGPIAIQFLKAKTFGIMTDYGTMTLPKFPTGYTVVFFWPNDAPGDHWNNFMDIIKQGEHAIEAVAGIANNVIKIGQSAASLLALFA